MRESLERRKHGFVWPFHPLQITGWVVFGVDVVVFASLCLPLLGKEGVLTACLSAAFALSVAVLVLSTALATGSDAGAQLEPPRELEVTEKGQLSFCMPCKGMMVPRTKHCRDCNKCVDVFDHHCKWLNNCIGKNNYKWFLICIGAVGGMTSIVLGTCSLLFHDLIVGDPGMAARLEWYGINQEFAYTLSSFMLIMNLPLFVLDIQLILLHLYLKYRHMTTFEYILYKIEVEAAESHGKLAGNSSVLPRCLDWIVFKPKKRRAKVGSSASVAPAPEPPTDPPPPPPADVPAAPVLGSGGQYPQLAAGLRAAPAPGTSQYANAWRASTAPGAVSAASSSGVRKAEALRAAGGGRESLRTAANGHGALLAALPPPPPLLAVAEAAVTANLDSLPAEAASG